MDMLVSFQIRTKGFFSRLMLLLFLLPSVCLSQPKSYNDLAIAQLAIDQGLSNNSVRCIYQDHSGFIWFGTYDGLNRYDGYGFKIFRNKLNDSSSLPHNYIYAIHEDQENRLWIGTGQGLTIYNSLNATFLPVFFKAYKTGWVEKFTFNVNSIGSDAAGHVFIATNGWGLLTKEKGTETVEQIPFINGDEVMTGYNVRALTVDNHQRIWLFILDIGLCEFDPSSRSIRVVNKSLSAATCLKADVDGNLWIGTVDGLYQYSVAKDSIVHHYTEGPRALTVNQVVSLCFDQQHNLWIGTEGGGVNILNRDTGGFDYLLPGEGEGNISSESAYAIHSDRENRIWIGTLKGGINIIDWQKSRFQTYTHNPLQQNSLVNNFVSTFYEDKQHNIWIGTDGGGISLWDRTNNHFTNFQHQAGNARSLSHNSVSSVRQDYMNNTWVATFGGGINRFNPATGGFEHFHCINSLTGEENKNVWLLYEDREKTLWATTFGNGKLYRFNRHLNRFEVFDQELNDLISLTEDHYGTLWAGNSFQLVRIDKKQRKHGIYEIGKPIRAIYEDRKDRLWIGTEGSGLILFDRDQGKIIAKYSDADGLCNNSILNILEDDAGQLWLSTFNGLSRFDPVSRQFKNFYQSDGIQSNQFSYNAAIKLATGELVFGGIGGFSLFQPQNITSRDYMPPVLFTDIRVNNKPLPSVTSYISRSGEGSIEALEIPYREAVLSFTFTALEYTSSEKIKYAYFLEGWDKGWNYSDKIRTINYNNISEGSYLLRVKSTNAEGVWNDHETTLSISVLPPWYRTGWAYLAYLLMAGVIINLYFSYKKRQEKLKFEIRLAHLNSEKEKEINEKRQTFFTNVSHEFRTPLTLIINPIKDILEREDASSKSEKKDLNIVYRNARRLLSLVDQLLLFRKAEEQADQLRLNKLNLYRLCNEVFLCFMQQAKAKNIQYIYECKNENLELYADREKMEIIFYNLLSNALKYTPDGGKVVFSITETSSTVEAVVTDNGYGMSNEAGKRLFEKFYQVKDKTAPTRTGFGIGLYLVKHSVETHKGQITFTTEPGKGMSFHITLLKGKAHFHDLPIDEEGEEKPVVLEELAGTVIDPPVEKSDKQEKSGLNSIISERESVLVIDDNESMCSYVAGIFRDQFTVYEASNAEEGLALAKKQLPEIIISDVVMGKMSGIELCRIIKETPSLNHIPVILLTGSFSRDSKLNGVKGGADDYITKPFEKDLLLARVTSLLKNRENLQKYFYNEITHQENSFKISAEYKEFLETCIKIVEQHLDDDEFTIQAFAREIGMSHSKLYKKIKAVSGQSTNAFIRFIRLRKAAELFINTNYNVSETAFYVGIKDIKYFREQFYKTFGLNPSEYIEKYRKVFGKNYKLSEEAVKEKDDN